MLRAFVVTRPCSTYGGAGSRGPEGHGPPDFADIEKRTEAEIEINNLLVVAHRFLNLPPPLHTYVYSSPCTVVEFQAIVIEYECISSL